MIRDTALFLLIAVVACAIGIMLAKRHAPEPLPLVSAAVQRVNQPPQILVPLCPVTPWNGIAPRERTA